jgi:hypothetical protein
MKNKILTFIIIISLFSLLYFFIGFIYALILIVPLSIIYFLNNLYQSSTGMIKFCLNHYYSFRLMGKTHEDSLKLIILSRFKKDYKINFLLNELEILLKKDNNIDIDLLFLCYPIMLLESGADPFNSNIFKFFCKKFYKAFDKFKNKIEKNNDPVGLIKEIQEKNEIKKEIEKKAQENFMINYKLEKEDNDNIDDLEKEVDNIIQESENLLNELTEKLKKDE